MGCQNSKHDTLQEERSPVSRRAVLEAVEDDDCVSAEGHSPETSQQLVTPAAADEAVMQQAEGVQVVAAALPRVSVSPEDAEGMSRLCTTPTHAVAGQLPRLELLREMVGEDKGYARLAGMFHDALKDDGGDAEREGVVRLCEALPSYDALCGVRQAYAQVAGASLCRALAGLDAETRTRCEEVFAARDLPFTPAANVAREVAAAEGRAGGAAYAEDAVRDALAGVETPEEWRAVQREYEAAAPAPCAPLVDTIARHMPEGVYTALHRAFKAKAVPFTPAECIVRSLHAHLGGASAAPAEEADASIVDADGLTAREASVLSVLAGVGSFAMWEQVVDEWCRTYATVLPVVLETTLSPTAFGMCHDAFRLKDIAFTLAETLAVTIAADLAADSVDASGVVQRLALVDSAALWDEVQDLYMGCAEAGTRAALLQALAAQLPEDVFATCRDDFATRGLPFSAAGCIAKELAAGLDGADADSVLAVLCAVDATALWADVLAAFPATAGADDLPTALAARLPTDALRRWRETFAERSLPCTPAACLALRLHAATAIGRCTDDTAFAAVSALLAQVSSTAAWKDVQDAFAQQSPGNVSLVAALEAHLAPDQFEECAADMCERGVVFTWARGVAAKLLCALHGKGSQKAVATNVLAQLDAVGTADEWGQVQGVFASAYGHDALAMCEKVLTGHYMAEAMDKCREKGFALYPRPRAIAGRLHTALDMENENGGADAAAVRIQVASIDSLAMWDAVQHAFRTAYQKDLHTALARQLDPHDMDECRKRFRQQAVPFTPAEGVAAHVHAALTPDIRGKVDCAAVHTALGSTRTVLAWSDVQVAYREAHGAPLVQALRDALSAEEMAELHADLRKRGLPVLPEEVRAARLHGALVGCSSDGDDDDADDDDVLGELRHVALAAEWEALQVVYADMYGAELLPALHARLSAAGLVRCSDVFKAKQIPFTVADAVAGRLRAGLETTPADTDLILTQLDRVESVEQWAEVKEAYAAASGRGLLAALKAVLAEDDVKACASVLAAKDVPFADGETADAGAAAEVEEAPAVEVAVAEAEGVDEAPVSPDADEDDDEATPENVFPVTMSPKAKGAPSA